jgi:hypothetical protein
MSVVQPEPRTQEPVAPETPQARPEPLRLAPPAPAAVLVSAGDASAAAVAEEHRWVRWLVLPFVLGAALFAAAVASGVVALIGPAMLFCPGLVILGFVYLSLTSDSNTG